MLQGVPKPDTYHRKDTSKMFTAGRGVTAMLGLCEQCQGPFNTNEQTTNRQTPGIEFGAF